MTASAEQVDNGSVNAWPFLVGRGRQAGHQVIVAPDFLVAGRELDLLESDATFHNQPGGGAKLSSFVSSNGPLAAAVVSEQVTEEALDWVPAYGGPTVSVAVSTEQGQTRDKRDLRDRHGRPLQITYGFVVQGDGIERLADVDIESARACALQAYRDYLASGEPSEVVAAASFHARSRVRLAAPKVQAGEHQHVVRRAAAPDLHPPRAVEGENKQRSALVAFAIAAATVVAGGVLVVRLLSPTPDLGFTIQDPDVCRTVPVATTRCALTIESTRDQALVLSVEMPVSSAVAWMSDCPTPLPAKATCQVVVQHSGLGAGPTSVVIKSDTGDVRIPVGEEPDGEAG